MFSDQSGLHQDVTLHAPAGYATTADQARPLVVFLHMYGTGAPYAGWSQIQAADVLWLAPLGAVDAHGYHYWHGSSACCDRDLRGNDDVGYVGGLIDRVIAAGWNVDRSRIWVVGASSGGFMAERLACDRADVVTAIVDLAGAGHAVTDPPCTPARPVPALVDHSDADAVILAGGGSFQGLPVYPAVLGAGGTTDRGNCTPLALVRSGLDHDSSRSGGDTDVYEATCDRGPLTYWREASSVHVLPPTSAWGSDVLAWLQARGVR